ncbi:MAG: hypothetical protein COB02_04685 [Candidatus Cloacimonadota bacterium]|nr:MAG: hypothetical protein COB02_04685 [Candidatus Cloacimonadota bacterium]
MNTCFFGIFSYSIGLNLIRNFKLFSLVNSSKDAKDYFKLKKNNLANPHIEFLSCIYIMCYISLTCSFFYLSKITLFLKFFIYTYALYTTYRIATSLVTIFKVNTKQAKLLQKEQQEEIEFIEEIIDIKPFLALEPIVLIMLELIFFTLVSLWIYSKTNLNL